LGLFIITFIASGGLIFLSPHGRQTFRVYLINPVLHLLGWGLSEAAKKAQLDEYQKKHPRRPPFSEFLMGSSKMKDARTVVDTAHSLADALIRLSKKDIQETQARPQEISEARPEAYQHEEISVVDRAEPSRKASLAIVAEAMATQVAEVVGDGNFQRAPPTGSAAYSASACVAAVAPMEARVDVQNDGLRKELEDVASNVKEILKLLSAENTDQGLRYRPGAGTARAERGDHASESGDV